MNARIQELMAQAKAEIRSEEEIEGVAYDDFDGRVMEKLAELIVRECIDCLKPLSRNHSTVGAAQDTIKEHFGVGE